MSNTWVCHEKMQKDTLLWSNWSLSLLREALQKTFFNRLHLSVQSFAFQQVFFVLNLPA